MQDRILEIRSLASLGFESVFSHFNCFAIPGPVAPAGHKFGLLFPSLPLTPPGGDKRRVGS